MSTRFPHFGFPHKAGCGKAVCGGEVIPGCPRRFALCGPPATKKTSTPLIPVPAGVSPRLSPKFIPPQKHVENPVENRWITPEKGAQ